MTKYRKPKKSFVIFNMKKKTIINSFFLLPYFLLIIIFLLIPLLLVIVKPFQGNIANNWNTINTFVWQKIILSIILALITTVICIFFSYPFAYFLAFNCKKICKSLITTLVTMPIWSSFLIKLVGLKSFFDICNGNSNSTFGHIFTVIGLVYIYLPFMILPIYNVLNSMPVNLLYASHDLGYGDFWTIIKVVIPYTKNAFLAGITLVFLPAITTVAVPQFLNNNNNASTIAEIIVEEGEQGLISDIALVRAASLSIVTSMVTLSIYLLFFLSPKIVNKFLFRRIKTK